MAEDLSEYWASDLSHATFLPMVTFTGTGVQEHEGVFRASPFEREQTFELSVQPFSTAHVGPADLPGHASAGPEDFKPFEFPEPEVTR